MEADSEQGGFTHRVPCLLCEDVVVMQSFKETGLKQLLQGWAGERVTPHPVHLHTELEQQRLQEPGRLQRKPGSEGIQ